MDEWDTMSGIYFKIIWTMKAQKTYIGRGWSLLKLGNAHMGFHYSPLCAFVCMWRFTISELFKHLNIFLCPELLFFWKVLFRLWHHLPPRYLHQKARRQPPSLISPASQSPSNPASWGFLSRTHFHRGEIHTTILMRTIGGRLAHSYPCAVVTSLSF